MEGVNITNTYLYTKPYNVTTYMKITCKKRIPYDKFHKLCLLFRCTSVGHIFYVHTVQKNPAVCKLGGHK